MESIITIVGFLGAGKTTLLKQLMQSSQEYGWNPYVILNDYENAYLDAQQLESHLDRQWIQALNGNCICCSGIVQLRDSINRIPKREKGITLIEANGTSDACKLMGFLGVGIDERFAPPTQVAVVDVKNWQKRGEHNELESHQVQVASLIVLNHLESVSELRLNEVKMSLRTLNPYAEILSIKDVNIAELTTLKPANHDAKAFNHLKSHWSSCSIPLPHLPNQSAIKIICDMLPEQFLRVKGCTQLGTDKAYTYFERSSDGTVNIRAFKGEPLTGPMLLTIGPGSDPALLEKVVNLSIEDSKA